MLLVKSGWLQTCNTSTVQHKTWQPPTSMYHQYQLHLHHNLMPGRHYPLSLLFPLHSHQLSPLPTLYHHSHTPPISLLGLPLTTTLHHPATQWPHHLSPRHHLEQHALPPLFLHTHNSLKSHLTLLHLSHPHQYLYNQLTFHLMLYQV